MLPQTGFFGKWKRLRTRIQPLFIIALTGVVSTAVILTVLGQSETYSYLPAVFKNGVPGTPAPNCEMHFANEPLAGFDQVVVADDIGHIVSIVNLTTGETMGTDWVEPAVGYRCPGLADYTSPYQLSFPLTAGHELQAQSDDGDGVTAMVAPIPTTSPVPPFIQAATVLTTPPPGPTPVPPDLQIIGAPQLVSTPPIVAYQPVQFTAVISNSGDSDVISQFFVDLFIDPTVVLSSSIPITESDGYAAVSALPAQATRVITLTSHLGFGNEPPIHMVYAMVDSLGGISEPGDNNLSTPAVIINVTPAATPTSTSTPSGDGEISGVIYRFQDGFSPQWRADVYLIDNATGNVIAVTSSDANGAYTFAGLPLPSATVFVQSCLVIDGQEYFGYRFNITPPQDLVYISLLPRPCPLPPPPTATPTYTATPTWTPTATPTDTPTGTPLPICPVQFEGYVIETQNYVAVTGEVGSTVTIYDLTDGGPPIGESLLFGPLPNHDCPGFATIPINPAELILGHVLAAISSDGTTDTTIVLGTPPTPTPNPLCPVQFEGYVLETQNYVAVTGEVGSLVTIVDLTDGSQVIGESLLFGPLPNHGCPGFATIPIDPAELIQGHVLAAVSSDGTTDTTIVLGAPPTNTPTPTIMSGSRTP